MDLNLIGIIILCFLLAFLIIAVTYERTRNKYNGRQTSIVGYTSISCKYQYKVIFKDKRSLLVEEVSSEKRRFLISSWSVTKSVRPGDLIKIPNSKESKRTHFSFIEILKN